MAGIVFPIAYKVDDADLKNAEGSFKKFAGNIAGILGGIGLATGVIDSLKVGFEEAMDAAKGQAQLEAGIKSTGGAAGVTTQHLQDLAASIQGYSGQTDDSIVKTEQLLLTFTNIKNSGTDKIFDLATKAAADMAAKMGTDASSAAIQLGKALNDPTNGMTALRRVGVQFTADQEIAIKSMQKAGDVAGAQKVILNELATEFGGAAEAAGKSLPGQIEIAKRSFEDLMQSLVEQLLPAIKSIVNAGLSMMDWIKNNKELVTGFVVVIGSAAAAFGAYKLVTEAITVAQKAWLAVTTLQKLATGEATLAQLGLNTALLANPIGLVVTAVAALVAGLVYFFTQTKEGQAAWSTFTKFLTDAWKNFVKFFGDAVNSLMTFFKPVFEFIGGLFKNYVNMWINLFEGFVNGIITGLNGVIQLANTALSLISKATGGAITVKVPTIPKVNLPNLAEGGIVPATPGGRVVNVAEAGQAEAIVPLSKLGSMGSGTTINLTVNAGLGTDGNMVARDIVTALKRYERTNGAVWVSA